jgi:hypothetical protein
MERWSRDRASQHGTLLSYRGSVIRPPTKPFGPMSKVAPKKLPKKYLVLVVLLGLPLLTCGGCLTWWFGRNEIARRDLERQRTELQSRGLPIDNQSLTDFRMERMDDKHSKRWMAILEQVESKEFQESCSLIPVVGMPKDEATYVPGQPYAHDAEAANFLKRWEPLRAEIHEITEGSQGIWTEIEFDSFNTLLPYVQNSRTVSRVLTLECEDAIRRDDRDQVFHSLMAMIGTARTLESEPLIISQLVHIALLSSAQRKVKQAVELNLLNEPQLLKILEQLRSADDFIAKFRLAIAGERAMSQTAFDDPSRLGKEAPKYMGARTIDALASLKMLSKAESIETEDLSEFFSQLKQLESDMQADLTQGGMLRKFDTILTNLTMPAWGAYGKAVVRSAMENRIAKIAIGVRIFELRSGRWPDSLDELTSDAKLNLGPIAPTGTEPFGYATSEQTAVLWGFPPQDVNDRTPEAPVDPATLSSESDQEQWEYWSWKLQPSK